MIIFLGLQNFNTEQTTQMLENKIHKSVLNSITEDL